MIVDKEALIISLESFNSDAKFDVGFHIVGDQVEMEIKTNIKSIKSEVLQKLLENRI